MNTFQAGLMCTLLLVGTIAGLFGCMSAVRCHRRLAFAIYLAITLLDFVPLAVLLSRLPTDEKFSSILWTAALLLTALSLLRHSRCGIRADGSSHRFPSRKAATTCPVRCALRGKTVCPA